MICIQEGRSTKLLLSVPGDEHPFSLHPNQRCLGILFRTQGNVGVSAVRGFTLYQHHPHQHRHADALCNERNHRCVVGFHGFHPVVEDIEDHAEDESGFDDHEHDPEAQVGKTAAGIQGADDGKFEDHPADNEEKLRRHGPLEKSCGDEEQQNVGDDAACDQKGAIEFSGHMRRDAVDALYGKEDACDTADGRDEKEEAAEAGTAVHGLVRFIRDAPENEIKDAADDEKNLSYSDFCECWHKPLDPHIYICAASPR